MMTEPAWISEIEGRVKAATMDTGLAWAWEALGENGDGSNIVGTMFHPDDENAETPLLGRCDPIYSERDQEYREYYRDEMVAEVEHRNRRSGDLADLIAHAPTDLTRLIADNRRMREALLHIWQMDTGAGGDLCYMARAQAVVHTALTQDDGR